MNSEEYAIRSIPLEQLRYIEQHLSVGIWSWILPTDRLRWSEGLFRILGLDQREITPSFDVYHSVVHPDDRLDFSNKDSVINTGKLVHRRLRIIRPSGEMRWIESHGQLVFGPDGRPVEMLGFARDVTDVKSALDTSAAFKSLVQALRELTGGRIWQTAPDGSVIDEIGWWQSVDRSHPPGGNWSRLDSVHPDDVQAVRGAWTAAIDRRGPYRSTFRMRQLDGSYEKYSSVAYPVRSDDGETLGWIGASRTSTLPAAVRLLDAAEVPASLFRAARGYLGLSGDALADRAGVSYSTIRRLEGGATGQVGVAVRQQVLEFLADCGLKFTVDAEGIPQLSIVKSARS